MSALAARTLLPYNGQNLFKIHDYGLKICLAGYLEIFSLFVCLFVFFFAIDIWVLFKEDFMKNILYLSSFRWLSNANWESKTTLSH